jgi:hypothetical protein
MPDELLRLRNELLAEVESIAPVVAEHAAASEAIGRLGAPRRGRYGGAAEDSVVGVLVSA